MRSRLLVSAIMLAAVAAPGNVAAQAYPNRPVRLIIPFPPGGNVDVLSRVLVREVEARLGQPIVIDNRGGANGIVGCDLVAKAAPDGYTLMNTSFAFAVNPAIYRKLPYDTEKDFAPITNSALGLGYLMTIHPSVPARSVKELIALTKSKPLHYSSPGIGNGQHLAWELLSLKSGLQVLHVPYKGGGPAINAVVGGEVQLSMPAASVGVPHVRSGKLRALAFSGAARLAVLPDTPTLSEQVPGFVFDAGWHGWFAPSRTPAAIVNQVHAAVHGAMHDPKVKDFFAAGGYEAKADPPAVFRKIFVADLKKYAESVKAAKIEPQ